MSENTKAVAALLKEYSSALEVRYRTEMKFYSYVDYLEKKYPAFDFWSAIGSRCDCAAAQLPVTQKQRQTLIERNRVDEDKRLAVVALHNAIISELAARTPGVKLEQDETGVINLEIPDAPNDSDDDSLYCRYTEGITDVFADFDFESGEGLQVATKLLATWKELVQAQQLILTSSVAN